MKENEIQKIVYISIILTGIYIVILRCFDVTLMSINGIKSILSFSSILLIIWSLYFKYGWKIKLLNKILYKPNLNGTWLGTYRSMNEKTKEIFEGEICLIIRQSYLSMNITSFTDKFISYSYTESLVYHKESESNKIVYVYSQDEFDPTNSETRKGTSELKLILELNNYKLRGDFWTNNKTKGVLELCHLSTNHSTSFLDAKELVAEEA